MEPAGNATILLLAAQNASHAIEEHKTILEGGFLSGRNPLHFNASFPLPTFIIQLLIIVGMSRLVKLVLSPIRQPGTLNIFRIIRI
jgi:hypothetical protein